MASKIQHAWKRRASFKSLSISHRRQNSVGDCMGQQSPCLQSSGRYRRRLPRRRLAKLNLPGSSTRYIHSYDDVPDSSNSDLEYTSSSEQSCTTVIYLGRSHPLKKFNAKRKSPAFKMDSPIFQSVSLQICFHHHFVQSIMKRLEDPLKHSFQSKTLINSQYQAIL